MLQSMNRLLDEEGIGDFSEKSREWFRQIEEWKATKPLKL